MHRQRAQHFSRAFEIAVRTRFSAGRGYLDHVVEDLPFSVYFVDADLRIHYSNFAADTLRRQGTGPFAGADGVLRKPIDLAELFDLLARTAEDLGQD